MYIIRHCNHNNNNYVTNQGRARANTTRQGLTRWRSFWKQRSYCREGEARHHALAGCHFTACRGHHGDMKPV
ncbi:hypothetical protein JOB18_011616 [Solea senegalensis]|uniref:Uncharacterized protein n=1 Tax=Solea senegalensis TaxID=28829 RepID=A0AAV6QT26_SOLSE|nr:hypothetical protein JOB18_011616 [Solea senegalensis]